MVDIGIGLQGMTEDSEGVITRRGGGYTVAFTDCSRDEEGRVACGCCDSQGGKECELGRLMATVWNGEITSIRLGLESLPVAHFLVLSHSRVAIASVKNAVAWGHACSADLRLVVDLVGE